VKERKICGSLLKTLTSTRSGGILYSNLFTFIEYNSFFLTILGEQLYLSCTASANPSPLFQWMQKIDDQVGENN
jgi:hypothetical protein